MEQNNQGFISLQALAHMEDQKFYKNYPDRQPRADFRKTKPDLSSEDNEKAIQQEKLQYRVGSVMGQFFEKIINQGKTYNSAIAIPMMLSRSVLGSEQALRIATGNIDLTSEMVDDFLAELQNTHPYASFPELSRKINRLNRLDNTVTYAECVWLYIFCAWLGCYTGALNTEVINIMRESKQDEKFSYRLDISYKQKLGIHGDEAVAAMARMQNLQETIHQQYLFLSNTLSRM